MDTNPWEKGLSGWADLFLRPQFFYGGDDFGQGALHFGARIVAAKGKAHAGTCPIGRITHRHQDMRGMQGSGGAGGAAGTTNPLVIEHDEEGLGFHPADADVARVGQTFDPVAVHFETVERGEQGVFKMIAQVFDVAGFFLDGFGGDFGCFAEANDVGDIFGAGAFPIFLCAPIKVGVKTRFTIGIKHAYPLGAVEFMAGEGKEIDFGMGEIDGDFSDGLHGVGVKKSAFGTGDFGGFFDGKEHAGLVICPHQRDEGGVFAHGIFEIGEVDLTLGIDRQPGDFDSAPGECFAVFNDGAMFDGTGHDVLPVWIDGKSRGDGGVIRFGAARGKNNFCGRGAEEIGDFFAGDLDGLFNLATERIGAAGVAVKIGEIREHFLDDERIDRSGAVIIEVNDVGG